MNVQYDWADFLQRFSTKVLWHFTGYAKSPTIAFRILKKIILGKTLKIGTKQTEIIMPSGNKKFGYACSCMCDIPFKDLRIHTARYGDYGIAFKKKESIIMGHFNPVLYIHFNHPIFKYYEEKLMVAIELLSQTSDYGEKLREYLLLLGTYIKRGDLTAPISIGSRIVDDMQNNNFYYEREWRSPYNWKFSNDDIEAIMIPKSDFEEMKKLLDENEIKEVAIIPSEMVLNL